MTALCPSCGRRVPVRVRIPMLFKHTKPGTQVICFQQGYDPETVQSPAPRP